MKEHDSMNKEDMVAVVREVLEQQRSSVNHCYLGIDKEQHTREHHFIRGLIKITEKLDSIKWGFFGALARTIGIFLIGATVIGLIIIAKDRGVLHIP